VLERLGTRWLTMPVLAVLAGGCAPAVSLDLMPRDGGGSAASDPWTMVGESTNATLTATFDGACGDCLLFDITVVNRSDSVLRINPREFSCAVSSKRKGLSARLRRPVSALEPDAATPYLERDLASGAKLEGVLGAVGFLVLATVLVADIASGQSPFADDGESAEEQPCAAPGPSSSADDSYASWSDQRTRLRERWSRDALRPTVLEPAASAHGLVALPAGPLRRALGPEEVRDSRSITSFGSRPASDLRLVLHAPAALGPQTFEFDVDRK